MKFPIDSVTVFSKLFIKDFTRPAIIVHITRGNPITVFITFCETVDNIIADKVVAIPQDELMTEEPLRPAPKIFKETCHLDFTRSVENLYNQVRGLSPYPAAWCEFVSPEGEAIGVKIFEATRHICNHNNAPGSIITDSKKNIEIACEGGYLQIKSLQLAGKKRLSAEDLLRGFRLTNEYKAQ